MNDKFLEKITNLSLGAKAGIIFEIFFLIGAVITFSTIHNTTDTPNCNIKIDNFDSVLSNLPEDEASAIVGNALYKAITKDQPNSTVQLYGHTIRQDSVTSEYNEEKNITTTTFIIDTNGNGSYKVAYRWSDDGANEYLVYESHTKIEKLN